MYRRFASFAALLAVPVFLGAASPPGDAARGRQIALHGTNTGALPCVICHGSDLMGKRAMITPRIAGLPPKTTLAALAAIASGRRGDNYVMRNIARSLTPPERADIAAYLAGLKPGS